MVQPYYQRSQEDLEGIAQSVLDTLNSPVKGMGMEDKVRDTIHYWFEQLTPMQAGAVVAVIMEQMQQEKAPEELIRAFRRFMVAAGSLPVFQTEGKWVNRMDAPKW